MNGRLHQIRAQPRLILWHRSLCACCKPLKHHQRVITRSRSVMSENHDGITVSTVCTPRDLWQGDGRGAKSYDLDPQEVAMDPAPDDLVERVTFYAWPVDGRFEDLTNGSVSPNVWLCVLRDFGAG